jgi:uncharacterized membrane protein YkoI
MKRMTKNALLSVVLAAGAMAAYAATEGLVNDAQAALSAPTSLSQAIAAAEQHVGGKASRAKLERSRKKGTYYEVEVVKGTDVFDVRVDADKGNVISTEKDHADHDDDD